MTMDLERLTHTDCVCCLGSLMLNIIIIGPYVMAMRREERMSSRLNVFLVATFVGSLFFLAALFVTVSLYFWYDNSNKIGYILLTCAPFIILTANICLALAIHFTNFAILTQ